VEEATPGWLTLLVVTLHVAVTGALGYSGRAITEQLLERGARVRTLTNSPGRPNPFGGRLELRPLAFADRAQLVESLRGIDVLVNTYWVRFNHRLFTFDQAVANTRSLFAAAAEAGVRRIVYTSILKPEEGRGLAYYEGKLALEQALRAAGTSYAIVRPGVLFGRGDILVNNIAWMLRRKCRSSASSATGAIASSPCTSTTSRRWSSSAWRVRRTRRSTPWDPRPSSIAPWRQHWPRSSPCVARSSASRPRSATWSRGP
jgi:NAD(P)-dependent dehydrogenase (short-subunit alcohol dehydrogenase family)